jgi:hypothetical protein
MASWRGAALPSQPTFFVPPIRRDRLELSDVDDLVYSFKTRAAIELEPIVEVDVYLIGTELRTKCDSPSPAYGTIQERSTFRTECYSSANGMRNRTPFKLFSRLVA